jgi:cytoskeletal protein CcmA (bactofilin family)
MRKKDDEKRKLVDKELPTESIIARGTDIKGTIIRTYSIRISGHFEGEINSERHVMVDKGARIEGTIRAPHIIIDGELNGNVESAERVELRPECRMIGNINTNKLAIAEGSFFQGEIKMPKKKDKPVIFVEKRNSRDQQNNQGKSLYSKTREMAKPSKTALEDRS